MVKRNEMVSRQAEDGSFEILVDQGEVGSSGSGAPGPKKKGRAAVITAVVLVGLLVVGAAVALSGDDGPSTGPDLGPTEAPAFRPYVATEQPEEVTERVERPEETTAAPSRWVNRDRKDGPFRPQIVEEGYQGEDLWELRDVSVQDRQPDGVETFVDSRQSPISRRETEMRARRELDAIQNAEHQFEQRLRRRDAILNSRILQPTSEGGGELTPGMEIDENLRRRIQEEFRARPRPTDFLRESHMPVYEGDEVSYDEIPDSWRGEDFGDHGGD